MDKPWYYKYLSQQDQNMDDFLANMEPIVICGYKCNCTDCTIWKPIREQFIREMSLALDKEILGIK